jgi:cell cycle sensor histidine kinase DivJ
MEGKSALPTSVESQAPPRRRRAASRPVPNAAPAGTLILNDALGRLGHELRTPLQAIIGFSQLLLKSSAQAPLTPQQRQFAEQIKQAGDHLLAIVETMLDLSLSTLGALSLERAPSEPAGLVRAVRDRLAPLAQARGQSLVLADLPDLAPIDIDSERIMQVLSNLVANAIKFTPEGGTITLGVRAGRGDSVEWYVRDTGPGIPRELRHTIFAPYTHFDVGEEHQSGAGMGLALAQQIARLHGGTVRVTGRKGQGSTFWVRLPRR